jgi:AcrR family transcriptional regulator
MAHEKKLTTRQQNALITEQTIYETAIDLFIKKGYENVKIEEITNEANVAKGTFYIYFDSKKQLLYHTLDQLDEIYSSAYEKVCHIKNFEELLVSFLATAYQTINSMGKEIAKALYYNSVLEKDPKQLSNERALFKIIRKIVQVGLSANELNNKYSEDYYVELIKAQIVGIDYLWIVSSENIDFSTFTEHHIYALTHGLLNM